MLIGDIKRDGSGLSYGRMVSGLFGKEVDVVLYGDSQGFLEYAEKCAEYFNRLPERLLDDLREYSLRYCEDMRVYFDPDAPAVPENVTAQNVLDYAQANCLIIQQPKDETVIGFSVEFSCAWEPEHGMEWTIRDGRALYVADFMGISPWYDDRVYATECRSYVYEGFYL